LCTFVCDEKLSLFGGETILKNGQTVSLVTSQGYGHSVGKMIMMGYLPATQWDETDFEVELFGDHFNIRRVDGPLYDADNLRLKN